MNYVLVALVVAMVGICCSCSTQGRTRLMPVPVNYGGGGFGGGFMGHFRKKRSTEQRQRQQQQQNKPTNEKFQIVETEFACVNECLHEVENAANSADGMILFEKCEQLCNSAETFWRDELDKLLKI